MSYEHYKLELLGEQFEMTPDNSTLYTHAGRNAVFDHVFLVTNDDPPKGTYIPSTAPVFEELKDFMRQQDYPRIEGLRDVSSSDAEVLTNHFTRDLVQSAFIPEDWIGSDGEQ